MTAVPAGEWHRDGFSISTDPARLDRPAIREFLAASYWSPEIPQDVVDRGIEGSLVFGLYAGEKQIGFARAITDRATFA
ncbi:MAG TPA: GNAT family N-acetyltransferase, partial [Thermoanaerobaculia bacterium]